MRVRSTILMITLLIAGSCAPKDEDINKSVQAAISSLAPGVSVTTTDGIVTLTGMVESQPLIGQLGTAAQSVKGVKSVVNQVTVKEPEIVISADDVLKGKVEEGFAKYGVTGITATVADGEVTLTGDITRDKLMDAMKAANEALPRKVNNQMNIK